MATCAVVVALYSIAGCASAKTGRKVGAVLMGSGFLVVGLGGVVLIGGSLPNDSTSCRQDCNGHPGVAFAGKVIIGSGAALFAIGVVTFFAHVENSDASTERTAAQRAHDAELVRANEVAMKLLDDAVAAARTGDCATVKRREIEVRRFSPDIHARLFVTNVAIRGCLEPAAPAP
jgi:hypothetical protein